jgi:aspartate/methionine/tyrosine aminotransferase
METFTPSPFELKKRGILSELHSAEKNILDLTLSSPMQAGIVFDISDDLRYLAENPKWQFGAPDARGQLYARQAIAEYEGSNSDNIFVASSTSEAYSALFKVFCEKGDCVLTPNPGYPLIDAIAKLDGLNTHPYFLKPNFSKNNWEIDLDSLYSAPPNAKIFLLIAPHNPAGHIPTKKEFEHILQFCEKNNLALIIDAVFNAYNLTSAAHSATAVPLIEGNQVPVFILNGLSKSAGLPHIKVAWINAIVPNRQKQHICDSLEYVLDSQLNCSYLSQALCARVLPRAGEFQKKVMERLKANQKKLGYCFSAMGAKIIPSVGGWYQSFYFPNENDEEFCLTLLKDRQILAHPGFLFDFEDGWLVGSLLFF